MDGEHFQRLLGELRELTEGQVAAARRALAGPPAPPISTDSGPPSPTVADLAGASSIAVIESQFATRGRCPHCDSQKIQKWAKANDLQRWRCRACGKTCNALTGSPLAGYHKRKLWLAHAQLLDDGLSLRKVAKRLGVALDTAFRWRHRFMTKPKTMKAKSLSGTVEADETYLLYSEKGSRKLTRPARKRGGVASKRGLSDEQVPVMIARDRSSATTDAVLPDRSAVSIKAVLGPVVAADAVLVSDGAKAYRTFANEAKILHVSLNLSANERTWGIYHVQNVNAYTSRWKTWMIRFCGVATKYLDTYLSWHRMNDRHGKSQNANLTLLACLG